MSVLSRKGRNLGAKGAVGQGRGLFRVLLASSMLGSVCWVGGVGVFPANAQTTAAATYSFAIPAQPLIPALVTFSDVTGLQLFFDSALARDLTSPGVSGNLTAEAALRQILSGTGMTYRFTNAHTVTLERVAADGAMTLDPVSVTGTAPLASGENARGPVVGYVAGRSVTATKTDTPILEIPQAVNVVTSDQIRDQGAQSVSQALRYTPGVLAEPYGASAPFDIYTQIRGFRSEQYLDGLRLGDSDSGGTSSAVIDPYALERVEVLKGPSSGLYGQSPPGGLINMVSKRPTANQINEVELETGSFDHYRAGVDVGGGASADGSILYRLTAASSTSGSQVDHTDEKRILVAPTVTLGARSDTTMTLLSRYQKDWGTWPYFNYFPASGTLLDNPYGDIPTDRYLGEPDYDEMNRMQYSLGYDLSHRFSDNLVMRQNLRYGRQDFSTLGAVTGRFDLAADDRTLDRMSIDLQTRSTNWSIDTNLEGNLITGPLAHKVITGLDYQHLVNHYRFLAGAAPSIDIFDPVYGLPVGTPNSPIQDSRTTQQQVGLYAQDQIKWGGWITTLGLRHDWSDSTTYDAVTDVNSKPRDDAFSGRAALSYVFDNGVAPYVSYGTSFRPQAGTDFFGQPFKATKGKQQELGVKYQPRDDILLTTSAFNLVEQNRLTSDPDPSHVFAQVQTGEVRVRGLELEGRAQLVPGLNLIASYTYLDHKVTKSNTEGEVGRKLFATPNHQASLWADYVLQSGDLAGFGFGGGARYVGTTYDSSNTLRIPSYTIADAALHYDLGRLSSQLDGASMRLNAQNLFDKKYVSTCDGTTMCTYGSGRTILATIRYAW